MNVCGLQIRVITDIFRHAEFVRQVMVVVTNIHVVHCVSAIANQRTSERALSEMPPFGQPARTAESNPERFPVMTMMSVGLVSTRVIKKIGWG